MSTDDLLAFIEANAAQGMTSLQVAQATGLDLNGVSSRLSKLAMYGRIRSLRTQQPRRGEPGNKLVWLPKAPSP